MKQPHLTDVLEKTSKSVFTSTVVVSSDSLSPTASTSSATRLWKTQKRTVITLNQQIKETSKWILLWLVAAPNHRNRTKKIPVKTKVSKGNI
jgi:hypothetical protein